MNSKYKDIIEDEIVVDCYDEYEVAMGWTIYLSDNMSFPFKAKIRTEKSVGNLKKDDIINVVELMNSNEEIISIDEFELTVGIEYEEHIYDIPLNLIDGIDCQEETLEAIEAWHYWCEKF